MPRSSLAPFLLFVVAQAFATVVTAANISAGCSTAAGTVTYPETPNDFLEAESKIYHTVDGYYEAPVQSEYLNVVRQLFSVAKIKGIVASSIELQGMVRQGRWQESERRSSHFYSNGEHYALLTIWDFVDDGASLCLPIEAMNYTSGGNRGSLARATVLGDSRTIWKLQWVTLDKKSQIELYIEDDLGSDGKYMYTPTAIRSLASTVNLQIMDGKR